MALAKRSAGNCEVRRVGGRHRASAPIEPRLLTALIQKGAAIPKPAVMTPPRAGPSARLMLTPTLFIASAGPKSSFGTRSGTTDCHAGDVAAEPVSTRKVKSSNVAGVMRCSHTMTAKSVLTSVMYDSAPSRNRRLSTISVSAPEGIAKRNMGRLAATCTRETIKGDESSEVMSHADAELYIQPPILDARVAIQTIAYERCRKGLHKETKEVLAAILINYLRRRVDGSYEATLKPRLQAPSRMVARRCRPHIVM